MPHDQAKAHGSRALEFLNIQAGYREPSLWRGLSHAAGAGIEERSRAVTRLLISIDRDANKKSPARDSGRAQITSFNFPNNPSASDSSRA
jgi:hypothetical protein